MKSILVAGDPNSREFVNRAYGDLAPVTFANSVKEAEALIAGQAPTILIGTLAFDESNFLNLLAPAHERHIKVIIVECPSTVLNDESIKEIQAYAVEMGVDAWWNMRRTVAESGMDVAAREIRAIVQNLLNDGLAIECREFA